MSAVDGSVFGINDEIGGDMKSQVNTQQFKMLGILLLLLFPMLSCSTVQEAIWPPTATPTPTATSTPTPTPTPTPTRIPLVERELRDIALKKSDLPDPEGFFEVDIPDLEQLVKELADSGEAPTTENLEKGFLCYFTSKDGDAIFLNFLLVYEDEGYAKTAFQSYIETLDPEDALDLPTIGDETSGMGMSSSDTTGYAVAWRYREAMIMLAYVGEDDIGVEDMVHMAQAVQSRLEAA
jgi:hypothetical protein